MFKPFENFAILSNCKCLNRSNELNDCKLTNWTRSSVHLKYSLPEYEAQAPETVAPTCTSTPPPPAPNLQTNSSFPRPSNRQHILSVIPTVPTAFASKQYHRSQVRFLPSPHHSGPPAVVREAAWATTRVQIRPHLPQITPIASHSNHVPMSTSHCSTPRRIQPLLIHGPDSPHLQKSSKMAPSTNRNTPTRFEVWLAFHDERI